MKSRGATPYLTSLDLKRLNEALIDIYRRLNEITDSANEVTFRNTRKGTKELLIKDNGKEYVDVSNLTRFAADLPSEKKRVQTNLKKDLSLDKVTNESKTTMFTDSQFANSGSASKPVISNGTSNILDISANAITQNDFKFRLKGGTSFASTIIQLMEGASARWSLGFDSSTESVLRINSGGNIGTYEDTSGNGNRDTYTAADVLSLTSAGNLSVDGTSTIGSIANVGSDTDKFLVSDSGTVKYRTGAEVLSDIGAGAVAGSSSIVTTGALDAGSITSGFGAIDNGSSNITTTGTISGGTITGSVIWQSFPFYALTLTHSRYYYIDVDDTANSLRRWDDYDVDPTGFNYRDVAGQFVVPENCTLKGMHGVISNQSSTNNPTIGIYHGTVTEGTGDTTLALAAGAGGAAKTVTISTLRVPYKFNDTYSVNLDAGDIIVPTIYHADSGGTRTFQGSLTLKFITR